jgi:hypothetical protein
MCASERSRILQSASPELDESLKVASVFLSTVFYHVVHGSLQSDAANEWKGMGQGKSQLF